MAHNTLFKSSLHPRPQRKDALGTRLSSLLKIEILTRLLFIFYLNLTIKSFSCLKTWVDVSWVGEYL